MIAQEQGICGCHVHVAVSDLDDAVHVCNRLRPWLPLLLAVSANSAIYRDQDSGYASWRNIQWGRWPTAGPPPHLESADAYHATLQALQDLGAMLDDGMVYWDARPSARFPTVEVRVADVPATVAETVLLATLVRAAVMTALHEMRCGVPEVRIADEVLRAQYWRASREGLDGRTRKAVMAFVSEISPALRALGEYDYATAELARVFVDGNGAMRQRRAWQRQWRRGRRDCSRGGCDAGIAVERCRLAAGCRQRRRSVLAARRVRAFALTRWRSSRPERC